jgi:predicted dehydrogenase
VHAEGALACLAAGVPVLVEKPLATSLGEASLIVEAAERAGRPALVGQNFRYLRRERALRAALPRVGRIRWGSVVSMTLPIPDPMPEGTPFPRLWALGVHHLDAIRTRFPTSPEVVRPLDAAPADDAVAEVALALEWGDGARIAYRLRERGPVFSYVEMLECEDGGMVVHGQRVTAVQKGRRPRRVWARRSPTPEGFLLDRFLAAAGGGSADGLDVRENLATIAVLEAATRALTEGRPVPLAEVTGQAGAGP